MPSVSNGGGSHGRCCRCRQCRGLDQLAVGGIDENGVLYHYFKKSKASQIESSRTYDPFWSLYIFRLRRSNKSHAFTFSLRGEKGFLRVFYYHLLRRKPPDTWCAAIVGSERLARRLPTPKPIFSPPPRFRRTSATPITGVFYYHLLRRKPTARLQWVFNNH